MLLVEDNATDALVATALLAKDPDGTYVVEAAVSLAETLERLIPTAYAVVTGHDDETMGRDAEASARQRHRDQRCRKPAPNGPAEKRRGRQEPR